MYKRNHVILIMRLKKNIVIHIMQTEYYQVHLENKISLSLFIGMIKIWVMSLEDEAKGLECCSKERLVVIMRRLLLTGISFVLILILSGCTDPYSGKRPYDYGFAT